MQFDSIEEALEYSSKPVPLFTCQAGKFTGFLLFMLVLMLLDKVYNIYIYFVMRKLCNVNVSADKASVYSFIMV